MNSYFIIKTKHCSLITITLLLSLSSSVHSRNGFFPQYVGSHGLIAGSGTAYPMDAADVISNPAGLALLESHFIAFAGFLHQKQSIDTSSSLIGNPVGRQENRLKNIPLGTAGLNYRPNSHWAIGGGLTGGGGFVKYGKPITNPNALIPPNGGFNTETINQVQLLAPTIAYQTSGGHAYGISLILGRSHFKANIAPDGRHQVQGQGASSDAYGVGIRIGGIWKVNPLLTIGSSAAPPANFQRHHKYKDVFRYKMQIPPTFRFGTAWHLSSQTDFILDFKEIFYGKAKWLHKNMGWKNQSIILMGINHQFTPSFSVGVGFNYAKAPIGNNSVLANSTSVPLEEKHFHTGIRYKFMEKMEVVMFGFYVPPTKKVDNGNNTGGLSKGIILKGGSFGGELGIRRNF